MCAVCVCGGGGGVCVCVCAVVCAVVWLWKASEKLAAAVALVRCLLWRLVRLAFAILVSAFATGLAGWLAGWRLALSLSSTRLLSARAVCSARNALYLRTEFGLLRARRRRLEPSQLDSVAHKFLRGGGGAQSQRARLGRLPAGCERASRAAHNSTRSFHSLCLDIANNKGPLCVCGGGGGASSASRESERADGMQVAASVFALVCARAPAANANERRWRGDGGERGRKRMAKLAIFSPFAECGAAANAESSPRRRQSRASPTIR